MSRITQEVLDEFSAFHETEFAQLIEALVFEGRGHEEWSLAAIAVATGFARALSTLPLRLFPGDATAIRPIGAALSDTFNEEFQACLAAELAALRSAEGGQ